MHALGWVEIRTAKAFLILKQKRIMDFFATPSDTTTKQQRHRQHGNIMKHKHRVIFVMLSKTSFTHIILIITDISSALHFTLNVTFVDVVFFCFICQALNPLNNWLKFVLTCQSQHITCSTAIQLIPAIMARLSTNSMFLKEVFQIFTESWLQQYPSNNFF